LPNFSYLLKRLRLYVGWGGIGIGPRPASISEWGRSLALPALLILIGVIVLSLTYGTKAMADDSQQELTVLTAIEKDTVRPGDIQTVYVVVFGADHKPLANSTASAIVVFGKDVEKTFSGMTGSDGVWSFSWEIGKHTRTGLEGIDIKVDSDSYDTGYANVIFPVYHY
jgi:hypothetical protein